MNRFLSSGSTVAAGLLVGLLTLAACIEGPAGPAGAAGAAGAAGPAGPAGSDANQTCTECHVSDTRIRGKQIEWAASGHAANGNYRRGSSASCAGCHSHEGFIDRMTSGDELSSTGFEKPTPQNCRTCHNIHETYTDADWDRRGSTSHDLWLTGTTVDFGMNGNLCSRCHQPRTSYDIPVVGGGPVTFTSSRFGPHYGAQGSTLAGDGGYEVAGTKSYSGAMAHGDKDTNTRGCATCHMAATYAAQYGGHTLNMTRESNGVDVPNTDGCEECHSSAGDWDDFDNGGVQTTVEGLLAQLEAKLITAGIVTAEDTHHAVTGDYSEAVAGAYWNFLTASTGDQSLGVHNPAYVIALLTNAYEALP